MFPPPPVSALAFRSSACQSLYQISNKACQLCMTLMCYLAWSRPIPRRGIREFLPPLFSVLRGLASSRGSSPPRLRPTWAAEASCNWPPLPSPSLHLGCFPVKLVNNLQPLPVPPPPWVSRKLGAALLQLPGQPDLPLVSRLHFNQQPPQRPAYGYMGNVPGRFL